MPTSPSTRADPGVALLLDSTVLNNFVKVGRFPLLRSLFPSSLRVTAQVYDEMRAGGLDQPLREAVTEAWLEVVTPDASREIALYGEYARSLGSGEAASLAVAVCRSWAFATDDRAARAAARRAGVPLTGSVGILCAAVRIGAVTRHEGDQIFHEMKRHGYWSSLESLEGLL